MQPFVIPVKGLNPGENRYEWHADGQFFASFENSEIIGADLLIKVLAENSEFEIEVKCEISGTVTVVCDRCLENLEMPVGTSFESAFEGFSDCDLNQDIYDYVCLSLPMQRVHPDGECNEETIKYLNK